MDDNEHGTRGFPEMLLVTATWQVTLFLGLVTLALGIVVAFHPGGSLAVVAVLSGIMAIVSGLFHLARTFDAAEPRRLWLAISGLLLVVVGVVLIRHLNLTVALFGLLIGITWIVQGVGALAGALAGTREGAAWWGVFGVISLIAGIVVTASPVTSVTVLAVLLGIWFIIMGLFQTVAAFLMRQAFSPPSARPRAADEETPPGWGGQQERPSAG